MQCMAEKNTGHAEQIREMFMPRKAFDDELRRDRLSCREAAVVHCHLPHPLHTDKSTAFTVLML